MCLMRKSLKRDKQIFKKSREEGKLMEKEMGIIQPDRERSE